MSATVLLGRTRRIFGVMVVLAFSALVMVGCGKDDDDDSSSSSSGGGGGGGGGGSGITGSFSSGVIGKWSKKEGGNVFYEITSDGKITNPGGDILTITRNTFNGSSMKIEGDVLTHTIPWGDDTLIRANTFTVDGDVLTVTATGKDGSISSTLEGTFYRIP